MDWNQNIENGQIYMHPILRTTKIQFHEFYTVIVQVGTHSRISTIFCTPKQIGT